MTICKRITIFFPHKSFCHMVLCPQNESPMPSSPQPSTLSKGLRCLPLEFPLALGQDTWHLTLPGIVVIWEYSHTQVLQGQLLDPVALVTSPSTWECEACSSD